jgi:serine/threonine-protein kinase RsbW
MSHETAETRDGEEIGSTDPISLRIPSRPEYVLLARLVVSQVGQMAGFGPEDVYDLKLAVTEAATNVIRHARVDHFDIEYRVMPRAVEITVTDAGDGFDVDSSLRGPDGQGGFGLAVIDNLVDEVVLDSTSGGTRLTMIRKIGNRV